MAFASAEIMARCLGREKKSFSLISALIRELCFIEQCQASEKMQFFAGVEEGDNIQRLN